MRTGCSQTECVHCAACCRGWDIALSKEDIRTLVRKGYDISRFLELDPVPRARTAGKNDNCVFLDRRNLCVIHTRNGRDSKPVVCRQYPEPDRKELDNHDFAFYRHGGKVFTRDVMVTILDHLKRVRKEDLFQMFLEELDSVRKQENSYVDVFNYDDTKKASGLRNFIYERRAKKTLKEKFAEEDRNEFEKIQKAKELDIPALMENIKKRIPDKRAGNENLPEMLLAYFYLLQKEKPRDSEALAEYFFGWNEKMF